MIIRLKYTYEKQQTFFMRVFVNYVSVEKLIMRELSWAVPICTILLIGLAYLVSEFLDMPLMLFNR
ncbi:MAG: hypothetical protein ACOH2D_14560 [Gelidibacter sp.]